MKSQHEKYDQQALKSYVENSGLSYVETNSSWIFECPRCTKNKLYIYKDSGHFECYRCGFFKGRANFALAELLGKDHEQIEIELLNVDLSGFTIDTPDDEEEELVHTEVTYKIPPWFVGIDHPKAVAYLQKRGLPLDVGRYYNLMWDPTKGDPSNPGALVYPIYHKSKLYGWQSRIVQPKQWVENGKVFTAPKATTAPGCKKTELLMFWDNLDTSEHAILCEGPMDALKLHLVGGAVCTMGKNISDGQMAILIGWSNGKRKRVYLALDPDARAEADRLVARYDHLFEFYDMIPSAKDLGSHTPEEARDLFLNATLYGQKLQPFLINY